MSKQFSNVPIHWSKAAIASAAFGVIGLVPFLGLFLAGIAAVFGHVGRHETDLDEKRGRGLATFGLIAGYGSMLFFPVLVLVTAVSFPAFFKYQAEQTEKQMMTSRENAEILYAACEAYADDNFDRYPTDWELLGGNYLSTRELNRSLRSPYPGGDRIAYQLVPHDRPVLDSIADSVIVIQEIAPSDIRKIAVVDANGRVTMEINPEYETP